MMYPDPVHGAVSIPDCYGPLLALPPLVRLRNIRQLGFTPSVYIGAVHTRFEHTIGKTAVLIDLLNQLSRTDEAERERFIMASLLSEIGAFPFSYSTRWLFVRRVRMEKAEYAKQLIKTYIEPAFPGTLRDTEMMWTTNHAHHSWFRTMPAFSSFPDLTLLKLSGDIDYALRDAHYSGRYSNTFDYRFFRTLLPLNDNSSREQLAEGVRELYRSIYSLNSVYGDKTRRFLVLIFMRLAKLLADRNLFDVEQLKEVSTYVELDDDRFLALLRTASDAAANAGQTVAKVMLDAVEKLRPFTIQTKALPPEMRGTPMDQVERAIAQAEQVDPQQVIACSDVVPSDFGYVMLGKHFPSYLEAVKSDYFKAMTGLGKGTDRTGLLDPNSVDYVIVR
jgi:HD superfamily phosphohydrolase